MAALRLALAALCALAVSLTAAFAFDQAIFGQNDRALQEYRSGLDRVTEQLKRPGLTDTELVDVRASLEKLRAAAADRSAKLAAPLAELNQQIGSLGDAPREGAGEDPDIAKARLDLYASRDRVQSLKSQFDVLSVEAEQMSRRVSVQQRDQFFERIFDRNRSILNPSLWYDMGVGLGMLVSGLGLLFRTWWSEVGPTGDPVGLLVVPIFVALFATGYLMARRWITRWMTRYANRGRTIDDMARLWRIVRAILTAAAALLILFVPIRLSFDATGYLTPRLFMVWKAATSVVTVTILYYLLARRVSAPGEPEWRIVDLDDKAARRFSILVGLTALVAAFNTQLGNIAEGLYLPLNYTIGQSALSAFILLALMSLIVFTVRNQDGLQNPAGRRLYFGWVGVFTPFLWLLLLVGFVALFTGYLALANYIAHQMVRTSMVVGLLFILYHLFDATVSASFDPQSGFGIFFRRITGLGERAIERLGLVLRTGVDLLLVTAGVPLLVLLWTLTWVDFNGIINTLALGVKVGEITISPGLVIMVLAVLAGGVIATKLFNRWLQRRILGDTRINRGVQESILKGSTYAGYILALGFALTAAGLDFSNLAIIAGALGVGIGFGLQSIVNNFVSGLIILAERPIRVGDWVSLPTGEGVVRRINVRSTEIETFDSCSIILPNSLLVTEPVRNWTHNDNMGRFLVAVTVDYGSDAELVKKILLEAAREHEKVLTHPQPNVTLARFSQSGLDFELRAYVADILEGAGVASDLRFALLGLFAEKGISIAHPVALMQGPKA